MPKVTLKLEGTTINHAVDTQVALVEKAVAMKSKPNTRQSPAAAITTAPNHQNSVIPQQVRNCLKFCKFGLVICILYAVVLQKSI